MSSTTSSAIVAPVTLAAETGPWVLVERLREGDAEALGELYDQHAAALLTFARRLVGDADAAKDLVQEVFLTVPRAIQRYEGHAALRTFLISIAVNHARHHVRAAARRRAASERFAREPNAASHSPEHDLGRERLARELSAALDNLPLDQRVAFVLCEIEELTSAQAARVADVPEATIRTRLFHARRRLRALLVRERDG